MFAKSERKEESRNFSFDSESGFSSDIKNTNSFDKDLLNSDEISLETDIPEYPLKTNENYKVICTKCSKIVAFYIDNKTKLIRKNIVSEEESFKCSCCQNGLGNIVEKDQIIFNLENVGFDFLSDEFIQTLTIQEQKKR